MGSNPNDGVLNLFQSKPYLKVCAPMVRYSKLQFRQLVRLYDCDLAFSPMILADSFVLSDKARKNEFTTSSGDTPLIVQFASNNITDFVGAATLVSPFCNGVDLNCGCPQTWAKKLGIGCGLIDKPEVICAMVKECKAAINRQTFTVSVKTRILRDLKKTIDLCQKLDKAGVSFITIHGRTPDISTGDVNHEAIKLICENVSCPVIANGAVESLHDCEELYNATKCNGIMVANGLLTNPTLFTGDKFTFDKAQLLVEQWIKLCFIDILRLKLRENGGGLVSILELNKPKIVTFQCFHHHLVFSLSKILTKEQKNVFNNFKCFRDAFLFISDNHLIKNAPFISLDDTLLSDANMETPLVYDADGNKYVNMKYQTLQKAKEETRNRDIIANGKYFNEFTLDDLFL